MFTLYRIVKGSVAESVPDRASVQTRSAAFEAVSAPEHNCSAPLLKVERSVSDRFLKRSESSVNTLSEQKLQRNLVLVNDLLKSKGSVANCMTDRACVHTRNASEQFLLWKQNINSCSHCIGSTFEMEQKPIWYSVNIAYVWNIFRPSICQFSYIKILRNSIHSKK